MLYVVCPYICIYWCCALCIISKCVVSFKWVKIIFATFVASSACAGVLSHCDSLQCSIVFSFQ
jgi:hypothetical protein